MLSKFNFWLKLASILQILTGIIHSLSLISKPIPTNNDQEVLFQLMNELEMDFGFGFHLTMNDILFAFSVCFSFFLFFSAIVNLLILKSNEMKIINSIVWLNIVFYFLCFVIMLFYTFLPPIICTFLILFTLIMALVYNRSERIKK